MLKVHGTAIRERRVSHATRIRTHVPVEYKVKGSVVIVTINMSAMKLVRLYGMMSIAIAGVLLSLSACSELNDELPASSDATLNVHPEGWAMKASANFHGDFIREHDWDMRTCQTCHGSEYRGGTSGVSCRTCHSGAAGPENCTTCHGGTNNAPPPDVSGNTDVTARGVGAHQTHVLGTSRSRQVSCVECHNTPGNVYAEGHVDTPLPAEIQFQGTLSSKMTAGLTPTYDQSILRCSNVYCHGNFKNGNTNYALVWNANSIFASVCGTCHGDPSKPTTAEKALPKTSANGGTHPNNLACASCHGDVVNAGIQIIAPLKHMNGKLNVFGSEREL